jgi:peptidoglycan/LPS O-acetylase OafA/YrhL
MSATSDSTARGTRPVRPEIQALRAVAALLVVLYHLWPGRLPGGFMGVDVFFVISGFLITSHLAREATSTGRDGPPRRRAEPTSATPATT